MNDAVYERVKSFTIANFWEPNGGVTPVTRLAADLGIAGLDGKDFMETYAAEFDVDITGFDWVEYFGPEGLGCLLLLPFARLWEVYGPRDSTKSRHAAANFEISLRDLADWAAEGVWAPPPIQNPTANNGRQAPPSPPPAT